MKDYIILNINFDGDSSLYSNSGATIKYVKNGKIITDRISVNSSNIGKLAESVGAGIPYKELDSLIKQVGDIK